MSLIKRAAPLGLKTGVHPWLAELANWLHAPHVVSLDERELASCLDVLSHRQIETLESARKLAIRVDSF